MLSAAVLVPLYYYGCCWPKPPNFWLHPRLLNVVPLDGLQSSEGGTHSWPWCQLWGQWLTQELYCRLAMALERTKGVSHSLLN